eukprot:1291799-Prymnesium_polylepis.1
MSGAGTAGQRGGNLARTAGMCQPRATASWPAQGDYDYSCTMTIKQYPDSLAPGALPTHYVESPHGEY